MQRKIDRRVRCTHDRRVQRTRELLRQAIIALVMQEAYEDLTIEQITEQANLGRTTFYLHYRDKRELLLDSLDVMMDALLGEIYSPASLEKWEKEGVDPRRLTFQHAAEHVELYRRLFSGEMGGIVLAHFQQHLAGRLQAILEAWQEKYGVEPRLPNAVSGHYAAGGFTGLLLWWLQNDMPYPPEEMYNTYHSLMAHGVVYSSGVDQVTVQVTRRPPDENH